MLYSSRYVETESQKRKVKVQTLFKKQFYSLLNSKHRLTDGCDRVHKQFVALSITQIHYRHIAKREKQPVIDSTIDIRCIDNRTNNNNNISHLMYAIYLVAYSEAQRDHNCRGESIKI